MDSRSAAFCMDITDTPTYGVSNPDVADDSKRIQAIMMTVRGIIRVGISIVKRFVGHSCYSTTNVVTNAVRAVFNFAKYSDK